MSFSCRKSLDIRGLLECRCQILIPVLRDQNVVLDPHTADIPVFVEDIRVDVFAVDGVLQVRLDDEFAEVDLGVWSA